jgi:hypothetical protein
VTDEMNKKYFMRIIGILLFVIGTAVGLMLFGISTWANLEAAFYGFSVTEGGRLDSLVCPVLMTKTEIGTVKAEYKNSSDTPIQFTVRADFSHPTSIRSVSSTLALDPHQSRWVEFHMTSEDIDYGKFIFVRVTNTTAISISVRQADCGIMVLNIPKLTGNEIFTIAMIVTLGGIIAGSIILEIYGRPLTGKMQDVTRAMKTLGVFTLLGMLVSFNGVWVLGVLIFAVSILAIGVIIGYFLS